MFVKKKKNRSGSTSIVVCSKNKGIYKEHFTVGVSSDESEIAQLVTQGHDWIRKQEELSHPMLDLFCEESNQRDEELILTEQFLANISNILFNGTDLILNRVFDRIGFNSIQDDVFRKLVLSRLSYPASKAATVEYLKNHFDEDLNLSRIYRYLDKLGDKQHQKIQRISVEHTQEVLGGSIGVMFYDVTTLYFETDREDDLRKTGFSKEGRHSNPQIILGLLVSLDGYPLAYCVHEGNKYEGHTMLPVVEAFVKEYGLDEFIVVADSGLMNNANIEELERLGYKYVIGAKLKTEKVSIRKYILDQPKKDRQMFEVDKGKGRRLLVGYTDDRAKKDAYNRDKGVRRLEKAYRRGSLTKENINKRGYNKFLDINSNIEVAINYDKIAQDAAWDGLKGYLTNTTIPTDQVYAAYHNLWNVERAFRIAKSKIEIRPMFHFNRKRIEAHICVCFVALKVYKELERILKLAEIGLSVDKVLAMAKTITTIQIKLPINKKIISKTLVMKRHKIIAPLFEEEFWGTH
ncbi:IS1634 family transposase [Dysgonomonas sp. 511]|uniref:IS1634 family transposase n=1 Tax=Dysgonomonas sp. 511 TaxID=2302930 RepID=UPI0013D01BAB|nr:IS1634 family transposase [Dysgonomonas sp. 511]NDV80080.1 IS1634 family transposase [Dysgonomonas sp. 511]